MFYCVIYVYILFQLFENSLQYRINPDGIFEIIYLLVKVESYWYNLRIERIVLTVQQSFQSYKRACKFH